MSVPRNPGSPSRIKGRTHSPFSRENANQRRFGISREQLAELDRQITVSDATADQLRSIVPDLEVHYGDPETLEEKRFGWLKKRRRW